MALADARPSRGGRTFAQAGPADGLALGLAQALALVPGVSRSGATLTAARARGFDRSAARSLSWHAALPVILGATLLEGARSAGGGGRANAGRGTVDAERGTVDAERGTVGAVAGPAGAGGRAAAAGAGAAFLSTLAAARVLRRRGYGDHALLPYSLYRCLLATLVLGRLRHGR